MFVMRKQIRVKSGSVLFTIKNKLKGKGIKKRCLFLLTSDIDPLFLCFLFFYDLQIFIKFDISEMFS